MKTAVGWIKYNFRQGIQNVFAPFPLWYREAYTHLLVILEVQDFLDRQVVTTYGYLSFMGDNIFVTSQGYHFKDVVRSNPHLLQYTFAPHILADPFDFISTYQMINH